MSIANQIRDEIIEKLNIQADYVFVDTFTADSLEESFNELRVVIMPITEGSGLIKESIFEISVYHKTHNEAQKIAQDIFNHFTYFYNGNINNLGGNTNIKQITRQADLQNLGTTREKGSHYKFSLLIKHTNFSKSLLKLS
ncbi:MAG: hypothetical protein ACRCTS_03530 [Fusobacteriaceae bacterium]